MASLSRLALRCPVVVLEFISEHGFNDYMIGWRNIIAR